MPYPTIYDVTYSYTGFQAALGDGSFPGTQLDADMAGLSDSIASIEAFIRMAFRSDGVLKAASLPGTGPIVQYVDAAAAVQIVSSLPAAGSFTGQVVYLTTDGRLYMWDGSAWVSISDAHTPDAPAAVQIVSALPSSGEFTGQVVYLTTDGRLYMWDGSAWVSISDAYTPDAPAAVQIVSSLPAAGSFTGEVAYLTTDGRLYMWDGSAWVQLTSTVTAADIQSGLYSNGLRPIEYLSALPTSGNVAGRVVFNTTDNQMYMYISGAWKNFADIYTPDAPTGVEVVTSDPTTGNYEGRVIFNSTTSKLRQYVSGAWTDVVVAGSTTIADGSITTEKIAANAITAGKIAAGAIGTTQLAANAVTAGKIAAGTITATQIQAGTISATELASASVTAAKIASGAITTDKLAAGAVTAGTISAGAVGASQIASSAITSDKIAAGSITGDRIASNTITTGKIQAGAITATTIAAQTITADNISANAVSVAATTTAASVYPAIGVQTILASVTYTASAGAVRLISFSTAQTDETSYGVKNASGLGDMHGTYFVYINGVQVFSFDSTGIHETTTLHSCSYTDTVSRSGPVTVTVYGLGTNYVSAGRTKCGFRTPNLSVLELKK